MGGVRADMLSPGHVDNLKFIGECFLLQVLEAPVLYVGEGPVIQDVQEWLVIRAYNQVLAAEDEVPALVEAICHCQGFPLYGGISGFCRVEESATYQTQSPSRGAACRDSGGALACFLEKEEADPSCGEVCGEARSESRVKQVDSLNDLVDYDHELGHGCDHLSHLCLFQKT